MMPAMGRAISVAVPKADFEPGLDGGVIGVGWAGEKGQSSGGQT